MKAIAILSLLMLGAGLMAQRLPAGTEIRLILMKELNSGGSVVGEEVPFIVSEDVVVAGRVIIAEGTVAVGVVKQARREGALSASVFDKPARLAVELKETWTASGRSVPIYARLNGKDRKTFQFNRDNTKVPQPDDGHTHDILKSPGKRRVLDLLVDTLKGAGTIAQIKDNAERNLIMEVARGLRLHNTVELLLNNRILDLVTLGAKLSSPGLATIFAARAAVGAMQVTFRAAKEIAHIATHFPGFLARKFGGRNISAPLGLEISVFAG